MATIIQQTVTVQISKLVRDNQADEPVLSSDQMEAILLTLPGVVDQILDDSSTVVEITLE